MATRLLPHMASVYLTFAFLPFGVCANEPGWGVVVNVTGKAVTLDVGDSRGRRSTWTVAPNRSLRLRADATYNVLVRESAFRASIDAQLMTLAGDYDQIDSPTSPKWKAQPTLDTPESQEFTAVREFRSPWAIRWYQVVETGNGLELRKGFSTRDVEQTVSRYRSRLSELGFAAEESLVYRPYLAGHRWIDPMQTRDEDAIRIELGQAARRLQHRALRDALMDLLVFEKGDGDENDSPFYEDFEVFVGGDELNSFATQSHLAFNKVELFKQELAKFKCIVHVVERTISPEVHSFVRRTVASAMDIELDAVGLIASYPPAAAPSGPMRLRDEILSRPGEKSEHVKGEVLRAINDDPFLRTLRFAVPIVAPAERSFGLQRKPVIEIKASHEWRYHRISDQVALMDSIPTMAGMDLRWRLSLECVIANDQDSGMTLQTHVQLEIETKRRLQSARKYSRWNTNLSEFWIKPIGTAFIPVDVERATLTLQNKIMDVCTKDWSE